MLNDKQINDAIELGYFYKEKSPWKKYISLKTVSELKREVEENRIDKFIKTRAKKSNIWKWVDQWYLDRPNTYEEFNLLVELSNCLKAGLLISQITMDDIVVVQRVLKWIKHNFIKFPVQCQKSVRIHDLYIQLIYKLKSINFY
jgi:hypothetical protein